MSEAPAVSVRGVSRVFEDGRLRALDGVDLDVATGEFVAIMGPSGCGKSTLLHLIAALDRPTEGSIMVGGHDLAGRANLNHYRARDVGIVFQLDNLLPTLSASENVQVPMFGHQRSGRARHRRAEELLGVVGLAGRAHTRPPQLSGGERQRVAIARALANSPALLLADEPTGRLDSESGMRILELLKRLREERRLTVVVVTHDPRVAAQADRIIEMLDGRIVGERIQAQTPAAAASS
ncbi:MAG: ABC transporter ATP-binding protein [Chloroflexi bacterium]|nr:ABC transporter ATP-binding protein [Chloroflexota bacterium]